MTPIQIIQTICKLLADSPSLSSYVQMAEESLDRCFFGKKYNYAVAYKACHLFTVCGGQSGIEGSVAGLSSGAVSGMSEGGLSLNFAVNQNGKDSELKATKYGRMLLDLMKTGLRMDVNRSPFSVVCGGC